MNSSFRCLFRVIFLKCHFAECMLVGKKLLGIRCSFVVGSGGPLFVPAAPLLITGSITVDIILMGHGGSRFSTQHSGGRWIRIARATGRNLISINNRTKNCGHYLKFIAGQLLPKQLLTNTYAGIYNLVP